MLGASLGLHQVDLIRYTFGEVEDVGGIATTLMTEKPVHPPDEDEWGRLGPETEIVGTRPVDADDMFVLHARFAGGGVLSQEGDLVGIPIGRMQGDYRFSFILPIRPEMFRKVPNVDRAQPAPAPAPAVNTE